MAHKRARKEPLAQSMQSRQAFYWPEFPGVAVSPEVFEQCRRVVLTREEFDTYELVMRAARESIASCEDWGGWAEQHLLGHGFRVLDEPAIVAVAEPDSRYSIQFVYLPGQERRPAMEELSEGLFDDAGNLAFSRPTRIRGQTLVKVRGNKVFSGTMLMYGFKCQPHNEAYARQNSLCCTSCPCVYNAGAEPSRLGELWGRHLEECTKIEQLQVPACALHRDTEAVRCDPEKMHRLAPECSAFAVSFTSNFVIGPHDDSGGCEAVTFLNRDGAPPRGKQNEWAFAICGHVLRLPARKFGATTIYLRGSGLHHGTLPTSYPHNNHGSALVSKRATLEMMARYGKGCTRGS